MHFEEVRRRKERGMHGRGVKMRVSLLLDLGVVLHHSCHFIGWVCTGCGYESS